MSRVALLTMTMLAGGMTRGDLEAQVVSAGSPAAATVICTSSAGERRSCPADTMRGITLAQAASGSAPCTLGETWGYDEHAIWVADGCSAAFALARPEKPTVGSYTPLSGFKVADTEHGDINFKLYTYLRYLNQLNLDTSSVDGFGRLRSVRRRNDIQFQKVMIEFLGWILDPKFRYFVYGWSANTSQGLSAQVVLGGNLNYVFNKHLTLGGGIASLPGVRATEGSFPLWLTADNRLMADEFFRPSYTMGVWVKGQALPRTTYYIMLANNLSELGIDAGQLDHDLNTVASSFVWLPTTGEYGKLSSFGDFDSHEQLATRLGAHYTYSVEDFQGQLNTDAFENVQIRLSDGSNIFTPNLFGPGIRVLDAQYQMGSADAGLKYRGFSLEGEYYWRGIGEFEGPGTASLRRLWDHGFQAQASGMVIPKRWQLYVSGSKIFGQYGNPKDFRAGVNWFPWKLQVARLNLEYMHLDHSPVGALSLPYVIGGKGNVIYTTFEINF